MARQCDRNEAIPSSVLLVDSQVELLEALKLRLSEESLRVIAATSGTDALRIIEGETIDVAIIDPDLDDMNGIRLGELIHERTGVPLLFLTTASTKQYEQVALAIGAINVLSKRAHLDDLTTQIQLSIKSAIAYTATRDLNETLVRKLNEKQRRETLIGAYMEIWGEDKSRVKATLARFARSRALSLDTLAELHETHSQLARQIKEEYSQSLKAICPDVLADLRRFHESEDRHETHNRRKRNRHIRAQQN